MQYTLLTAALGLASLSSASAISNNVRSSSLLKLPVTAVQQSSALSKRQNDVNVINSFQGTTYLVDVLVGTPSQKTTLGLDTGSSSTWVNPECATAGSSGSVSFCESISQFNWQASTTLKNEGLPMTLAYGVGEANGTFVTDVLTVGNAKITNQEIGICGKSVDMATGLIAVGPYDGLTVGGTGNPTLIDNLASEGFTNSRAFSLDLRDVDSPDGSIIFGGIDTGKYEGALEKLPIIPPALAHDHLARYWVNMNSIGITKPGQAAKKYPSTNQPVVLDSGSTISILPDALVDEIVADFGATYDAIADLYKVDCSYTSQDGTMDFTFGTKEIKVPYKQFIWAQQGQPCYLGVHKNSNFIILGDSFLRAAYVVFDQDNQNIHIAQAANCGTNLVEIGKGVNAVPSLVGDCGKTSTTTTSKTSSQTSSKTSSKTSSETLSETTSTSSPATTTSAPATTTAPASTYPASTYQASSQASYPVGNSTASGSISIVYSTTVYTISSCAATVTNCPYGQTTTEVISAYTTYCPETGTSPVATATGSVYPIQPSYTPLPTFTGSAGKAAASVVAVLMAAVAVVAML